MNKKIIAAFSLLLILSFVAFIIYDSATSGVRKTDSEADSAEPGPAEQWIVSGELQVSEGQLLSVAVSSVHGICLGGDSFLSLYNGSLVRQWIINTPAKITAVTISGDTIYASAGETILLLSPEGILLNEWGPYEANSLITSLSSNNKHLVVADANIKRILILNKSGEVVSMMGQSENAFIIPSPYFDVAISSENDVYIANTGKRRIETWTSDGMLKGYFGEPGIAPDAFCGCCNPAHFAILPQGFVTAEKGINRIKILDAEGGFIEYVSSENSFTPSVPLDVATADGITIYAANPDDSKLYAFRRK